MSNTPLIFKRSNEEKFFVLAIVVSLMIHLGILMPWRSPDRKAQFSVAKAKTSMEIIHVDFLEPKKGDESNKDFQDDELKKMKARPERMLIGFNDNKKVDIPKEVYDVKDNQITNDDHVNIIKNIQKGLRKKFANIESKRMAKIDFKEKIEYQNPSRKQQGTSSKISPQIITNPAPIYPDRARKNGWEGKVILDVEINESGNPTNVTVHKSSGFDELDRQAVKTVLNLWQFEPAQIGNQKVKSIAVIPIQYELN